MIRTLKSLKYSKTESEMALLIRKHIGADCLDAHCAAVLYVLESRQRPGRQGLNPSVSGVLALEDRPFYCPCEIVKTILRILDDLTQKTINTSEMGAE